MAVQVCFLNLVSAMEALDSTFPLFTVDPNFCHPKPSMPSTVSVSIKPPPPELYSRAQTLERWSLGPILSWRIEFVELEQVWLLGTTHILSLLAAVAVERVVEGVNPSNVMVELCRSRQVLILVNGFWLNLNIFNGFCLNWDFYLLWLHFMNCEIGWISLDLLGLKAGGMTGATLKFYGNVGCLGGGFCQMKWNGYLHAGHGTMDWTNPKWWSAFFIGFCNFLFLL